MSLSSPIIIIVKVEVFFFFGGEGGLVWGFKRQTKVIQIKIFIKKKNFKNFWSFQIIIQSITSFIHIQDPTRRLMSKSLSKAGLLRHGCFEKLVKN